MALSGLVPKEYVRAWASATGGKNVWAGDLWVHVQSTQGPGAPSHSGGRMVKQYFVGNSAQAYEYIVTRGERAWLYEMVMPDAPCPFYVDFEFENSVVHLSDADTALTAWAQENLGEVPWALPQQAYATLLDEYAMQEALKWSFTCITGILKGSFSNQAYDVLENVVALNGSRIGKCSLHIIFPRICMDSNVCSAKTLSFYLCRLFQAAVINACKSE